MIFFLRQYGYLASALMLLGVFLAGIIACPRQRAGMLLSACLGTPTALFAFFFVPDYWKPVLVVPLPVGLEDVIFCFSTGGIVWLLAVWPQRERPQLRLRTRLVLMRLLACALPSMLFYFALWCGGLSVMTSAVLTMVMLAIVLLWLRPRFLAIALMGTMGFSFFYILFARTALAICPPGHWNVEKLWGYWVLRVPLGEIVWAAAYGFVWPLLMAYAFNAELAPVPGALVPAAQEAIRGK